MSKNLATKNQVRNALYLLDKNTEIKKLQMPDASCFIRKRHFDRIVSQNYLIFQPTNKYFQSFTGTVEKISGWKSRELSEKTYRKYHNLCYIRQEFYFKAY